MGGWISEAHKDQLETDACPIRLDGSNPIFIEGNRGRPPSRESSKVDKK